MTLFEFANASVSGGCAVALTFICLLQYVAHMHRMTRIRREIAEAERRHETVCRELDGVANELIDARRDRSVTRFEAQSLREFVSQEDCHKAVRSLLRRFAPNAEDGFAAFLRLEGKRILVSQSYG